MQAASGLTLGSGDNVPMLTSQTISATLTQPEKDPLSTQCYFSDRTGLSHLKPGKHKGKGRFCPHCCFQIPRLMPRRCTTAPILTSSPRPKPKDQDLKLVALLPAKTEEPWSWRNNCWAWVKIILSMNFSIKYLIAYTYYISLFMKWLYKYRNDIQGLCFLSGKEANFFLMLIILKHTNIFQYINC